MTESYYAFIKRTEPPDSPKRIMLEKLKDMMIGAGTVIVEIDGVRGAIPMKDYNEIMKGEEP